MAQDSDLFQGKRVLDIGCHIGSISLQIAAHYNPTQVLGIDIDPKMIKAAIANMQKLVNSEECKRQIAENASGQGHDDENMLTSAEQERERQIAKLM